MDDGFHSHHRLAQPRAGLEIALHRVDVAARLTAQDAGAMARLTKQHHDVATKRSGSAGDQNIHRRDLILVAQFLSEEVQHAVPGVIGCFLVI